MALHVYVESQGHKRLVYSHPMILLRTAMIEIAN